MTVLIEALCAETVLVLGTVADAVSPVSETKGCETSYFVDVIQGWILIVDRRVRWAVVREMLQKSTSDESVNRLNHQ